MAPNHVMVAVQAGSRANPLKILTLLKNVLEKNLNKIYHEHALFYGEPPQKVKGRRVLDKLTAQLNLKTFLPTESK